MRGGERGVAVALGFERCETARLVHTFQLCQARSQYSVDKTVLSVAPNPVTTGFKFQPFEQINTDARGRGRNLEAWVVAGLSGPANAVATFDRSAAQVALALRYTERLAEAGIAPSVGSVGDSYDCEYVAAARGV